MFSLFNFGVCFVLFIENEIGFEGMLFYGIIMLFIGAGLSHTFLNYFGFLLFLAGLSVTLFSLMLLLLLRKRARF